MPSISALFSISVFVSPATVFNLVTQRSLVGRDTESPTLITAARDTGSPTVITAVRDTRVQTCHVL